MAKTFNSRREVLRYAKKHPEKVEGMLRAAVKRAFWFDAAVDRFLNSTPETQQRFLGEYARAEYRIITESQIDMIHWWLAAQAAAPTVAANRARRAQEKALDEHSRMPTAWAHLLRRDPWSS